MNAGFYEAMRASGLEPPDNFKPGRFTRFPGIGKKPNNRAAWCLLFADGDGGVFGDWSTGLSEVWHSDRVRHQNPEEQKQFRRRVKVAQQQAERERVEAQAAAAGEAVEVWECAEPVIDHPYLQRKGVKAHGIRQVDGVLVIPMRIGEQIYSAQFINAQGEKRFLPGGRTKGCWHLMEGYGTQLVIAEGYATAASIREATGNPVAVAFSANNLQPVADALIQSLVTGKLNGCGTQVVIAADHDENGAGQKYAIEAAQAVGGIVAIPALVGDWNDIHARHGLRAVRAGIEAAVYPAKLADHSNSPGTTGDTGASEVPARDSAGTPTGDTPGTTGGKPGTAPKKSAAEGFRLTERGVYHVGDEDQTWICSPLVVSALVRDENGDAWGRLLEFPDPDGRLHRWACPMELLAGDGTEFRRILMAQGLQIAPGSKARNLLAVYVQIARVDTRATATGTAGWHGRCFVLPDETIGDGADGVLLQTLGEPVRMTQAGTLETWQREVAAYCVGNAWLAFAVSAALAPPLLAISGDESGGVNFVGSSSTGKTTALRVASSVWGGDQYLHRWRATSNGLEAIAHQHNDGLLVLDELAQVEPREAGAIAYMLANGTGKHRARRDGLAKPTATWRLLFLSAGEIGLADHMREAGKRARAGQEVRLADIPADAGAGLGIFQDVHGWASAAELADRLNATVRQHHGNAARAFIQHLTQHPPEQIKAGIDSLRREFLAESLCLGVDGQSRRVGGRFALIAAAGELATTLGVTGWPPGTATDAAAQCFRAWLDRRGGTDNREEAEALATVKHFIEAHGEARFSDQDTEHERVTANRAGFRRLVAGKTQYLFLPEVFTREVCSGLDHRQVLRTLRKAGWLVTEEADRLNVKTRQHGRVYVVQIHED